MSLRLHRALRCAAPRISAAALAAPAAALLACAAAQPPAAPPAAAPGKPVLREQAPRITRAPIVRVSVGIAESAPPRYFAEVTSALPDGCTRLARAEVREPEGDLIVIAVFNERTAPPEAACTQIYGEQESSLPLRGTLVPGKTYTLDVNGVRHTFVAQ
jgi:hypothetical protein